MRQLAWLHATPEGSKKNRLTAFKDQPGDDDSSFLQFPDIGEADYLVALFHEAGLMLSQGMGPVPLTWQEIESWLRTTELTALSVWEKLVIKEMSEVYVSELAKSSSKTAEAPYVPAVEPEDIDREKVAAKLGDVLRGFKRKPS